MSKQHYEFQQIFEEIARKSGLKIRTVTIQSKSKAEQKRLDQMEQNLKNFIAEIEQAHQNTKNSKLHFCRKITTHKHPISYSEKQGFARCI